MITSILSVQFNGLVDFRLLKARSRRLAQVSSWRHRGKKAQPAALRTVDPDVTKKERMGTSTARMAIAKRFAACLALRPSTNRRQGLVRGADEDQQMLAGRKVTRKRKEVDENATKAEKRTI
jgi:hypothetical protein